MFAKTDYVNVKKVIKQNLIKSVFLTSTYNFIELEIWHPLGYATDKSCSRPNKSKQTSDAAKDNRFRPADGPVSAQLARSRRNSNEKLLCT